MQKSPAPVSDPEVKKGKLQPVDATGRQKEIDGSSGFPGLRAALSRLAGPKAEMQSHFSVFRDFLGLLWPPDEHLSLLPTQAATGLALEALLAHRKRDAVEVLRHAIRFAPPGQAISRYLAAWLRGHFITDETLHSKPIPAQDNRSLAAGQDRQLKERRKSRNRRR